MKPIYLYIILLALIVGSNPIEVQHYGVLREIMREQKLAPNVLLDTLSSGPSLFGLGALEGLSGELIILGGQAYQSRVGQDQKLSMDKGLTGAATLLVTGHVNEWASKTLTQPVQSLSDLESLVKQEAEAHGLDTEKAFPFLLEGTFKQVAWHVINAPGASEKNHDAFKASGISREMEAVKGTILGFYSEKHEGVFTHHGSYIHAHLLTEDQLIAGHVDQLSIDSGITLKLPKR